MQNKYVRLSSEKPKRTSLFLSEKKLFWFLSAGGAGKLSCGLTLHLFWRYQLRERRAHGPCHKVYRAFESRSPRN